MPSPGNRRTMRAEKQSRKRRQWPQVSHLHIIELYLERASEALSALQMQAVATPGGYVVTDTVRAGIGALRRPIDAGYRGADYDFVTAVMSDDRRGDSEIEYTLDTKRARSEVRAQKTQRKLLLNLVTGASSALTHRPAASAARCFSCWCRSIWRRTSAGRPTCRSSSTAAPPEFRGNCSTPTSGAAANRDRGRFA